MRISSFIALGFIAFAVLGCDDQSDETPVPTAFAIDGDTISIGGKFHDLAGIDAPELGQRCENGSRLEDCGESAAFALAKLIALDDPTCQKDKALTAFHCSTAAGNLAEFLLDQGHAVAKSNAPSSSKEKAQQARDEGVGIWRGDFINPHEWRSGQRLAAEKQDPTECRVFGIQTASDVKTYFTPTHPDFTELEKTHGQTARRFCSDEEARSAGYVWDTAEASPQ